MIPTILEDLISLFANRPNLFNAIRNISWLFVDKILRLLSGIFVGAWVARYLGPEDFGKLSYVLAYIGLIAIIVPLGINGPVVQSFMKSNTKKAEIISSAFVIHILSSLTFYILSIIFVIIIKFDDKQLIYFILIYGSTLLFKSSEVIKYYFESQVISKYVVISDASVLVLCSSIKILLILFKMDIWSFIWVLTLEAAFYGIALFFTLNLKNKEKIIFSPRLNRVKKILKKSFPIAISSIFIAINLNADKIFIGNYFPLNELGIYSAASAIVTTLFFVPLMIGASLAPRLNKIYHEDIEKYYKYIAKLYCYIIVGSFVLALLVSLLGEYLISILYGSHYNESFEILATLIWSIVFISIVSIRGRLLLIEGRQKMIPILALYGVVVNLVLGLLFIPKYGANGAAVVFLASWIVSGLLAPLLHQQTRNHAFMAFFISTKALK